MLIGTLVILAAIVVLPVGLIVVTALLESFCDWIGWN